MKLIYVLGVVLLFGLVFCEEQATEKTADEQSSDKVADETKEQPEQDAKSSDKEADDKEEQTKKDEESTDEVADETEEQPEEDEESNDEDDDENDEDDDENDEEEEDDETDVEDEDASKGHRAGYHGKYGRKCRTVHKKVCNRQKVCAPKYFYVKSSRRVRYCFNKLLHKFKRQCRRFCWHTQGYGHGKHYRKGRRVCRKRCYKVPLVKKVCKYRRIHFPRWTFKNVCKVVKNCYRIPVKKCHRRRHRY